MNSTPLSNDFRSTGPRAAVIDCGSNSIKGLVATRAANGSIVPLWEETIETRLGDGLGSSEGARFIPQVAMEAGWATLARLAEAAGHWHPQARLLCATSAVRDSSNGGEFLARAAQLTGWPVRLLSGDEEAEGIGRGILTETAFTGVDRFVHFDLGGGSLELIRFEEKSIRQRLSLPLGSVRLLGWLVPEHQNAYSQSRQDDIAAQIRSQITASGFVFDQPAPLLAGTGGGVTCARFLIEPAPPGVRLTDAAELSRAALQSLCQRLCAAPLVERRQWPGLPVARADIMPVALLTILTIMDCAGANRLTHSFRNLRYGIAAQILDQF